MSVGIGGTHTKSLMGPHKKPQHCVRSRDLGGQFINKESACPHRQIQRFGRCSFRCACPNANGEVPHSAGRNFHSSSTKQGMYLCDSNSHFKLYISESVYFFCKNQVHSKTLKVPTLHLCAIMFSCLAFYLFFVLTLCSII